MKTGKEKRAVMVICNDQSFVKGLIHINEGERVVDFMNDQRESFVVLTSAEFRRFDEAYSFKVYTNLMKKKGTIILNKSSIKWVEEL